ncbi:MAG: alpha/beta hydrolase [Gammaproteobacteria bacterium]|nr:alpha/beta hydrolase [Gammaproteobacteria bacterium]
MQAISGHPSAIQLNLPDLNIAAIRHCRQDVTPDTKLLCLHGWLDNANSFLPMMPYLPNVDMVAIDLPGHGYSDHLNTSYSIPEVAMIVTETAAALNWDIYNLLGHSLGGCIAPVVAAASPESINQLMLIEASGAMTASAEEFPERLQRAAADRHNRSKFQSRLMPDKQAAIDARLRAAKMESPSAKLIIDRQLQKHDEGYTWRFDPKLRMASNLYMTEAHVRATLSSIKCPTQTIIATNGFLADREDTEPRLNCLTHRDSVTLVGQHHLHMDTPEPVAAAINRFLGTVPALGG